MKKIDENFYGYIRVEGDTYTYNVSDNIVTLLPAQSDPQKRDDSLYRIKSHKTDTPEYLFGEDNNSMIAILRNGKFVTDPIGTNVAIRFATPIIIKACGNAEGFFNMLTEDWCKFHAITFCGGNINALYTPGIAIEQQKILTLYNENSDIVDEIVSKYSLPSVNENSIASFVKLRNNKTHSGTVEWGESAKIYTPLFAIVYASFFKYIKLPDEVIKSTLLQIF